MKNGKRDMLMRRVNDFVNVKYLGQTVRGYIEHAYRGRFGNRYVVKISVREVVGDVTYSTVWLDRYWWGVK